jgi:hypothetical protein
MATLTISLSGSGIVNGSKSYTLTDAMVTRLINATKYYSGDGTNAQVLAAWADSLIDQTKRNVVQAEKNTAAFPALEIT